MDTQDQVNIPKNRPGVEPTSVERLRFARFTSEVNQRLGRRAGVAGAGVTAAAAGLLWYLPATEWNFLSTWALFMLPWALACAVLSWTRARIDITDAAFVVKTSVTTPPRTVPYDASSGSARARPARTLQPSSRASSRCATSPRPCAS